MLTALLDLLLPRICAGCGVTLFGWRLVVCAACLASVAGTPVRAAPTPSPSGLPPVFAVAGYDGAVRSLVVAHKERGCLGLTPILAGAVARAAALVAPEAVVWVPSSRAAIRERGYDHARRLATRTARVLGVPAVPALVLARRVRDQSTLSAEQRAMNLAGALRAVPQRVGGRRVVVVDDVMTTGTTLAEATRALRTEGVRVAGAAVVAASIRSPLSARARPPLSARARPPPATSASTSFAGPPRAGPRRDNRVAGAMAHAPLRPAGRVAGREARQSPARAGGAALAWWSGRRPASWSP